MDPKNSSNDPGGSEISGFVSLFKKFSGKFLHATPSYPSIFSPLGSYLPIPIQDQRAKEGEGPGTSGRLRRSRGGLESTDFVSFFKKILQKFQLTTPSYPSLSSPLVFYLPLQSRTGDQRKESALERQGISNGPGVA